MESVEEIQKEGQEEAARMTFDDEFSYTDPLASMDEGMIPKLIEEELPTRKMSVAVAPTEKDEIEAEIAHSPRPSLLQNDTRKLEGEIKGSTSEKLTQQNESQKLESIPAGNTSESLRQGNKTLPTPAPYAPVPFNATRLPLNMTITEVKDEEETYDFESLVSRYKLKRNQSPPPRFKQWFKFAKKNQCYLDHYDALYRDLAPFMDMSPEEFNRRLELVKKAPRVHQMTIKNGTIAKGINHYMVTSVWMLPRFRVKC